MVQVIKPTEELAKQLAPNLRPMDILELSATNPDKTPIEVLSLSIQLSDRCYAIVDEGVCLGMFGVTPVEKDVMGVPWMLSTEKFFHLHSLKFLRQCRSYFSKMAEGYGYLVNFISVDNTVCQDWLEWLGFTIYKEEPMYFNGKAFYMFDMRN